MSDSRPLSQRCPTGQFPFVRRRDGAQRAGKKRP
jgi:hypothetical protein